MVERVFSMSAGLDASTVTPGSTAPVASFTVPAIVAVVVDWAHPFTASNSTKETHSAAESFSLILVSSTAARAGFRGPRLSGARSLLPSGTGHTYQLGV